MYTKAWIIAATLPLLVSGTLATGQEPARHACDLMTAAELAAAVGRQALVNAQQIRSDEDQSQPGGAVAPGGTGCSYAGSSVSLELQQLSSLERFNSAIPGRVAAGELEPFPGLGDAAWFRYNKYLAQHGIVVRSGTNLVIIMMKTDEAGSADKVKAQLLPLARAAVGKLR